MTHDAEEWGPPVPPSSASSGSGPPGEASFRASRAPFRLCLVLSCWLSRLPLSAGTVTSALSQTTSRYMTDGGRIDTCAPAMAPIRI
eukprot:531667-Pyramimonas_sp.AAC.1